MEAFQGQGSLASWMIGDTPLRSVPASPNGLVALSPPRPGTATVVETAAETNDYAQATVEVTVTIDKANATAATVNGNNLDYDGTAKTLATVTGNAVGGTMQYVLGTDATTVPTTGYTETIPTATNAGT